MDSAMHEFAVQNRLLDPEVVLEGFAHRVPVEDEDGNVGWEVVGILAARQREPSLIRKTQHFYFDAEGEMYTDEYDDGTRIEACFTGRIYRWHIDAKTRQVVVELPYRLVDNEILVATHGLGPRVLDGYGTRWLDNRSSMGWAKQKFDLPPSVFPIFRERMAAAGYEEQDAASMVSSAGEEINTFREMIERTILAANALRTLVTRAPQLDGVEERAGELLEELQVAQADLEDRAQMIRAVMAAARSVSGAVAATKGRDFAGLAKRAQSIWSDSVRTMMKHVEAVLYASDRSVGDAVVVAPLLDEIARLKKAYPAMQWIEVLGNGELVIQAGSQRVVLTAADVRIDGTVVTRSSGDAAEAALMLAVVAD